MANAVLGSHEFPVGTVFQFEVAAGNPGTAVQWKGVNRHGVQLFREGAAKAVQEGGRHKRKGANNLGGSHGESVAAAAFSQLGTQGLLHFFGIAGFIKRSFFLYSGTAAVFGKGGGA